MTRDDVLIVGAGPAGATAAILLAAAGARVRLLDKAVFPREKLCGEFVSPEALPVLARTGALPHLAGRSAGAERTSEVVFTTPSGQLLRLPVPGTGSSRASGALGISRREMDAALVARAAALGADVVEGFEVREILVSSTGVTGVRGQARGSDGSVAFSAGSVLAADGRDSALARLLDPTRRRRRASPRFGIKAHFQGVSGLSSAVELHLFRGGYVGLTDLGDGRVNVCSLLDRSVAAAVPHDPEHIVEEVFFRNPFARDRLEGAQRVSDWVAVGSLVFRAETPARAGVMFLGDAAGTIAPFAGEGMSMAFRSAEIAAEEILPDPGASRDRRTADARYAARWRREFARRIAFARGLGSLAIRPVFQRPMIGLLSRVPSLGRLLARATRAGSP